MWRFLRASVVGESHRLEGKPCQDASRAFRLVSGNGEPVFILCCSDGAGSAEFSNIGSRVACHKLAGLVAQFIQGGGTVEAITRQVALDWLGQVRQELAGLAQSHNTALREFACTIVAGIIGERTSAFFQIGDGALVVGSGTEYEVVFWPQSGEYSNTTFFLTDDTAQEQMAFEEGRHVDEVAAFTDGIQMLGLTYSTKEPFNPFFSPMFKALRLAESPKQLGVAFRSFLASPRVNERTDDDKSLILAVRLPPMAPGSDRVS